MIIKGIPASPKTINNTDPMESKEYLKMFGANANDLNFSAINGSSTSSAIANIHDMITRVIGEVSQDPVVGQYLTKKGIVPRNSALAGVGNPMNLSVCRVSRLNLANRTADKSGMINVRYGSHSDSLSTAAI